MGDLISRCGVSTLTFVAHIYRKFMAFHRNQVRLICSPRPDYRETPDDASEPSGGNDVRADFSGVCKQACLYARRLSTASSKTMMKGVTLVGRSSSLNSDRISGEEKYVIDGLSKLAGDTWLLRTRLQCCGNNEIPVPMPVTIKWAGDTPVITLTDLSIPGMGTYTARVVLYRDQYAGTWSGKKGGGQVFGKIVRNK